MFSLAVLGATARAQFNNTWLTLAKDPTRIVDANGASATYILTDPEEKDYAWGDVNHDGWIDLVVVRKEPATTLGKRVNYLLMNENGKLVDRTAQYASDADVVGDLGFSTPTNDRDIAVADLNADGWEDLVTSTTLGGGTKEVTHPRVYINKGKVGGVWQGFRYEAARIPQFTLTAGGASAYPSFCSVSVGDVTGDGSPDLYFADYGFTPDLDDRLLINDGAGNFTDSFQTRMTAQMLLTSFGTSSEIVDLNGDGTLDVVRGQSGTVSCSYNNPANVGFFNIFQASVGGGSPYHVDVGDLNGDSRPDLIFSDDGSDGFRFNMGNDALGRVSWGAQRVFNYVVGSDDGFAGNCLVVDMNKDGFGDALVSDFDVDTTGCDRRAKIFHNVGGVIGTEMILREEAQQASGGWRGAVGVLTSDLTGTYDMAAFDIDNDGDTDLVIGRCAGTAVFINQQLQPALVVCAGDGFGDGLSVRKCQRGRCRRGLSQLAQHGRKTAREWRCARDSGRARSASDAGAERSRALLPRHVADERGRGHPLWRRIVVRRRFDRALGRRVREQQCVDLSAYGHRSDRVLARRECGGGHALVPSLVSRFGRELLLERGVQSDECADVDLAELSRDRFDARRNSHRIPPRCLS